MKDPAYPAPSASDPLVLSYSDIALYKKCPEAFELGSARLIQPRKTSEAADLGTAFHANLAIATNDRGIDLAEDYGDAMAIVAHEYIKHNPLPTLADTLAVEDPQYTKLLRGVWLRTTFDLVYRDESGWIVGRDYKTFEKSPALDVDLDFQGRIYIAALMRAFNTNDVRFEYEYVRRVPPGTRNSKGAWSVEECYINVPVVIARREADELWAETQEWARAILRARRTGKFPRAGTRKEFGSPCLGCWYSDLCKAEMQHGRLDAQDLEFLANGTRERTVLPEALRPKVKA